MPKNQKNILLLISVVILIATSCYYDNAEELYPEACNTSAVTYSGDIAQIIATHCKGCHPGGNGPGDFTNYAGVFSSRSAILNRVVTQKNMPPAGPISNCEQKKLEAWVTAGAPNN